MADGRAIVRATKVFLFDEPLSNLDAALRGQTRVEIRQTAPRPGRHHHLRHARPGRSGWRWPTRWVVLRDGQIGQVGTLPQLYDRPANQFVAQFIWHPGQMNVVPCAQPLAAVQQQAPAATAGGSMGLRPEAVTVVPKGRGAITGQVELVEALGAETLLYVRTAEVQLVARLERAQPCCCRAMPYR